MGDVDAFVLDQALDRVEEGDVVDVGRGTPEHGHELELGLRYVIKDGRWELAIVVVPRQVGRRLYP